MVGTVCNIIVYKFESCNLHNIVAVEKYLTENRMHHLKENIVVNKTTMTKRVFISNLIK